MAAATAAIGIRPNGTGKFAGKLLVASSRAEFRAHILQSVAPAASRPSEAGGGADALIQLEAGEFATLVLDPLIEDLDLNELVETIRRRFPEVDIVVPETKSGATELPLEQLTLDLDASSIPSSIPSSITGSVRGSAREEMQSEAETFEDSLTATEYFPETAVRSFAAGPKRIEALPGMIGTSAKVQQVYRLARLVAPRDTAVLIVGATGTGKELVARGIHDLSRRSKGPFVVVNCAAIPESLLEAELFGFTRGAFTGAFQSRLGRIHAAHGGTLLLDEVGELPLSMQAKLLRFVQEGEVQRLGSSDLFRVNARLIAATNADLLQRVREKQFREDLYYRLAVFPIRLPALRQRSEDVLPLAEHFLKSLCQQSGICAKTLSLEAVQVLRKHSWPCNVRELQHWIERAFVLADGNEQLRAEDFDLLEFV